MDPLAATLPPLPSDARTIPLSRQKREIHNSAATARHARQLHTVASAQSAKTSSPPRPPPVPSPAKNQKPMSDVVFADLVAQRRKSIPPELSGFGLTAAVSEERAIASETRLFARRQLLEFRRGEMDRQEASRRLRTGLRNIDNLIGDVTISEELASDVKEKAPSEVVMHLKLSNTALLAKVLTLTELLESCIKSEQNLRQRLNSAELRAAAAEDRVIDLQSQLFAASLKSIHLPGSGAAGMRRNQ